AFKEAVGSNDEGAAGVRSAAPCGGRRRFSKLSSAAAPAAAVAHAVGALALDRIDVEIVHLQGAAGSDEREAHRRLALTADERGDRAQEPDVGAQRPARAA